MLSTLKSIFYWARFLLSAPACVYCGERLSHPYSPICPSCHEKYEEIKTENCSRCSRILHKCSCTNKYLSTHFIKKHFKVFRYQNREENAVANTLIYYLKRMNCADVRDFFINELVGILSDFVAENGDVVFTNIPRRRAAVLEFGYDHALELAKGVARHFGRPYVNLLKSRTKKPQKLLHGKDRETNVIFDLRRGKYDNLKGSTVVIIDDIVTTGSSMATAAALIRSLGVKKIVAASIAATYKDMPSPLRVAELERRKKHKK